MAAMRRVHRKWWRTSKHKPTSIASLVDELDPETIWWEAIENLKVGKAMLGLVRADPQGRAMWREEPVFRGVDDTDRRNRLVDWIRADIRSSNAQERSKASKRIIKQMEEWEWI